MQISKFLSAVGFGFLLATSALAPTTLLVDTAQAEVSEGKAFRTIIRDQIKALRSDDAKRAFSYATPTLQQRFQTAEIFMHMVKNGYRPVYKPKAVTFGRLKETDRGPLQEVYVTDADGANWLAVYSFEQQPEGDWRISGCYLKKDKGFSA